MRDVMRDSGVTGGALHHHFPTKKDLALAVIRERVAKAVEKTWIEPVRSAATARDGISAVFGQVAGDLDGSGAALGCTERKSVVHGNRVSVRVDYGVRRISKKQKNQ